MNLVKIAQRANKDPRFACTVVTFLCNLDQKLGSFPVPLRTV